MTKHERHSFQFCSQFCFQLCFQSRPFHDQNKALPLFGLENLIPESQTSIKRESEKSVNKHRKHIICCKTCDQIITKDEFSVPVNGYHEHLQCNPNGVTFIFRCYSEAWNCTPVSPPELEFSWFPGFYWSIIACSSCKQHLGWKFSSLSNEVFWGLLSDKLYTVNINN